MSPASRRVPVFILLPPAAASVVTPGFRSSRPPVKVRAFDTGIRACPWKDGDRGGFEILKRVAPGRANEVIGGLPCLSENTVKNHVESILAKLNAKDRNDVVTEALKRGLFQLGWG